MPRLLLTLMVWLLTIGGLSLYLHWRDTRPTAPVVAAPVIPAVRAYALELISTFDAEPDPFALRADESTPPALLVRLGERELSRASELARGRVLRIDSLPGLTVGDNELFLEASPPVAEAELAHGLRVRLLRGETELFDRTLWAPPGGIISGPIRFTLTAAGEEPHDH